MSIQQLPKRINNRVVGMVYMNNGREVTWNGKMLRCVHDKRPTSCKECGGSHICEHKRRKYDCVRCSGSRTCIHKKRKTDCMLCSGANNCRHKRSKMHCIHCGGSEICVHLRRYIYCEYCKKHEQKRECKSPFCDTMTLNEYEGYCFACFVLF